MISEIPMNEKYLPAHRIEFVEKILLYSLPPA
jgi:hypothetical protein